MCVKGDWLLWQKGEGHTHTHADIHTQTHTHRDKCRDKCTPADAPNSPPLAGGVDPNSPVDPNAGAGAEVGEGCAPNAGVLEGEAKEKAAEEAGGCSAQKRIFINK